MNDHIEEWENLLFAAARLQQLVPGCVLVGGSAAAVHAEHRLSEDADHVLVDLENRFEDLLAFLESHKDWHTNRIRPPKLILGNFSGVETGLRQLIRHRPLETETVKHRGGTINVPTKSEMLRIKAWLIVIRNATRDYIDFAAIFRILGEKSATQSLRAFNDCYRDVYQREKALPLVQLARQLAEPLPYDRDDIDVADYKGIQPPLDSWEAISNICRKASAAIAGMLAE